MSDREDVSPPEGGYQYEAVLMGGPGRTFNDRAVITADVARLYDLVVSSMDWGSGFLDTEEMHAVARLGRLCGFKVPKCDATCPDVTQVKNQYTVGDLFVYGQCSLDIDHTGGHKATVRKTPIVSLELKPGIGTGTYTSPVYGESVMVEEEWND